MQVYHDTSHTVVKVCCSDAPSHTAVKVWCSKLPPRPSQITRPRDSLAARQLLRGLGGLWFSGESLQGCKISFIAQPRESLGRVKLLVPGILGPRENCSAASAACGSSGESLQACNGSIIAQPRELLGQVKLLAPRILLPRENCSAASAACGFSGESLQACKGSIIAQPREPLGRVKLLAPISLAA